MELAQPNIVPEADNALALPPNPTQERTEFIIHRIDAKILAAAQLHVKVDSSRPPCKGLSALASRN